VEGLRNTNNNKKQPEGGDVTYAKVDKRKKKAKVDEVPVYAAVDKTQVSVGFYSSKIFGFLPPHCANSTTMQCDSDHNALRRFVFKFIFIACSSTCTIFLSVFYLCSTKY
jgi:hypothetical protein